MAKKKVFSIGSSLSDGLEQTFAAAQNYSNQLRIDVIPISRIETDPENPRTLHITTADLLNGIADDDPLAKIKESEKADLQTLAVSILNHGILNPVIVYESQSVYRLIAGERRTLASIIAGKTDIQAKIIDDKPSELKIRLLQWIENMERVDLSLHDRLINFDLIVRSYAKENQLNIEDVKAVEISRLTGCSKPHAGNLKLLLLADDDIKELIAQNKLTNIEKTALICQIKNPSVRQKAINAALKGATLMELKRFLDMDNDNNEDFNILLNSDSKKLNIGSISNIKVAKKLFDILIEHVDDETLKVNLSQIDVNDPKKLTLAIKQIIAGWEHVYE